MEGLKLNIGCFNNTVDGWVNIDITPHAIIAKFPLLREFLFKLNILTPERYKEHLTGRFKNIKRHDIRKGLPFKNDSCIFIYSSHFIEHLFYKDVESYFNECYRVLKKGGIVRTVVPDFYRYAQKYLSFRVEKLSNINMNEVFNNIDLLDEWNSFLIPFFEGTYTQRKKPFLKYGHKSLWDEITLAYVLRKTGFINMTKNDFREGTLPDLEKLEIRMKGSIYMEAAKP